MDINIIQQTENVLLSRTEILAEASFTKDATPSGQVVKDALVKQLKADPALVVVKHIRTKFGTHSASVSAYVYQNKEVRNNLEPKAAKADAEAAKKAAEEAKKAAEVKAEADAKAAAEKASAESEAKDASEEAPVEAVAEKASEEGK